MKTVKQPVNAQMTPASGATQAGQPADFEKRILLCVAGLSPQVVTETLYALAKRENPFIATEIHIITTAEGANRIRLTLLENDPQEQHFYRLCDCRDDLFIQRQEATQIRVAQIRDRMGHCMQLPDLVPSGVPAEPWPGLKFETPCVLTCELPAVSSRRR